MLLPNISPWPATLTIKGQGSYTKQHKHHAIHLVITPDGYMNVDLGNQTLKAAGVVTPPNLSHAIDATNLSIYMILIDPESAIGFQLKNLLNNNVMVLNDSDRALIFKTNCNELKTWTERVLEHLNIDRDIQTYTIHPKIKQLINLLDEVPLSPAPMLSDYAQTLEISSSRLIHLFKESTGVPWRTYLRWLRLMRACAAISAGASLVDAALEGGFHDSAHMTKTFKEMFGITPSQMI